MAEERTGKGRARRLLGVGVVAVILVSMAATAAASNRTDYLIHLLKTSDTFRVRTQAAMSLGRVDAAKKVTKALSGALRDPHPAVRSAAASSLERLGDPSALDALELARRDSNSTVRKAVARAIARLERIERTRPQSAPLPSGGDGAARFYLAVSAPKSKSADVSRSVLEQAREALVREARQMEGVVVAPENAGPAKAKRALQKRKLLGYHLDSSVVKLEESASGTRAVVSVILATYPGRDMRATLKGSATAPGAKGSDTAARAIQGALKGALRRLPQALDASSQRDGN
ncbi:MAG: HEAT repeat domain-containing protein [Myxococcota bacterium]